MRIDSFPVKLMVDVYICCLVGYRGKEGTEYCTLGCMTKHKEKDERKERRDQT